MEPFTRNEEIAVQVRSRVFNYNIFINNKIHNISYSFVTVIFRATDFPKMDLWNDFSSE